MRFHKCCIALLLLAGACGRPLPDNTSVLMPQIQSLTVTDITERGATLIASVTQSDLLVRYGFTIQEDGSANSRNVPANLDGNLITVTLSDLNGARSYTFQAYIDNGGSLRVYSTEKSFTTLPPTEIPEEPDNPENPENPDTPDNPENPEEPNNPENPTTDFIEIPDEQFRAWILWNYDINQDGNLSQEEARTITAVEVGTDNILSLSGIESFPNLIKLQANGTRVEDIGLGRLTAINLSGNSRLTQLYVPHNRIQSLDLSPVTHLVQCEVCVNELTELDVSMLREVELMNVSYNPLSALDVCGLDRLDELHCEKAPIRELLLDNKTLRYLDCHSTDIMTLDLSKCPKMNIVDCHDCPKLTTIYLAKGQVLGTLNRDDNVKIVYHE